MRACLYAAVCHHSYRTSQVLFHDYPRPCMACRSTSFLTRSTQLLQHCVMEHTINYCHFASNICIVTNANVLQMSVIRGSQTQLSTGCDQNSSLSSNHSERSSQNLSLCISMTLKDRGLIPGLSRPGKCDFSIP